MTDNDAFLQRTGPTEDQLTLNEMTGRPVTPVRPAAPISVAASAFRPA